MLHGTEEKFSIGLQKARKLLFVFLEIEQEWRKQKPLPEENMIFLPITCTLRAFSIMLLLSSRLGVKAEEKTREDTADFVLPCFSIISNCYSLILALGGACSSVPESVGRPHPSPLIQGSK